MRIITSNITARKKQHRSNQRGVSLIVVALSLVVVVGLAGLAIDTYFATTSRTQYQAAADAAALAALESYLNQRSLNSTRQVSADQARVTAEKILGLNVGNLVTANLLRDTTGGLSGQSSLSLIPGGSAGTNGTVAAGNWFNTDPGPTSRPPNWGTDCAAGPPCFVSTSSFSSPGPNEVEPNAFRVSINTNPIQKIRTTLLKVLGFKEYDLNATATATTRSRRAAFMLDLTPSIHSDTHSLTGAVPSLYAYPLATGLTCTVGNPVTVAEIYDATWLAGNDNPRTAFGNLPSTSVLGIDQLDFQCVPVDFDNNGAMDPDEYYAVDTQNAPQPLSSILNGINQAMTTLQQNAVPGDMVGVFGFDECIFNDLASSTYGCPGTDRLRDFSSRFTANGVIPVMVPPSTITNTNGEFERFLAATNSSNSTAFRLQQAALIPRMFGGYEIPNLAPLPGDPPVFPMATQTNLWEAGRDLSVVFNAQQDIGQNDNFVVLFTDGVSTCSNFLEPGLTPCSSTDLNFNLQGISEGIGIFNYRTATDGTTFTLNNIEVHVVLVGNSVAPHTLVRPGPDLDGDGMADRCLTDLEARALPPSPASAYDGNTNKFVDYWNVPIPPTGTIGNIAFGSTRAALNYQVPTPMFPWSNILYKVASARNGYWAPLRPPCNPSTPRGPQTMNDIDNACAGLQPYALTPVTSVPGLNSTQLDGQGRLLCDPENRTMDEQIQDLMTNIMRFNPFVLVD